MNILFVMRHSGYVRNFESTLRLLCERGHAVHLAFQIAGAHALLDAGDIAQVLSNEYSNFSAGAIPSREDAWGLAARELRLSRDYLRYLAPEYRHTPKLRARAAREAPKALLEQTERWPYRTSAGRALLSRWLRSLHRAIPTDPRIDGYLQARRPDLLVVTPLIEPGAPQAEYVRSARSLGIRTALCVASWDNLTNKGLIHGRVDLVAVWNEMMKGEAVDLHGVPAERIEVTGAQPFDHWFDWRPSTTREEFCQIVGLPADRPFVLYLCSSRFIAPVEAPFVRQWIHQLRQSSSPALQHAGVLIRPHPQNADQWRDVDLSDCGPAVVWPPAGQVPADAKSRAEYYDSIHHSAAVVGINTTAQIESAILGRSVYTLLAPEFRETQEGTLHFEHLRRVNGGLLHVAESFTDHLDQLDAALRHPGADDERCRKFVEAFVRPHGIDVPATARLVDALEALAARPAPRPERPPVWAALWAPVVRPRLARAGERLQREAFQALETKAMRRSAKARQEPTAVSAAKDAEPATRRAERRPHAWREVAAAYRELDDRHRVYFGKDTAAEMPAELLQTVFESAKPYRLDYPDAEIFLRVASKTERQRLVSCAKEPFTVDWIHRFRGGEVLYDIGANVGAFSLVAAKKPGGAARVFAFEPSYTNVASLCANIVLNDVSDLVTPMPFALSDTDAFSAFLLRALEPGSARHSLEDSSAPAGPTLYRQPVITFRLDELVERFGLPMPNHIKLDVDGGELQVLKGAARTLASPALRSMLVEISVSLSEEIIGLLTGYGLRLESKVDIESTSGESVIWYGLFTRAPQSSETARALPVEVVSR